MKRFFNRIWLSLTSRDFYKRAMVGQEGTGVSYFLWLTIVYSLIFTLATVIPMLTYVGSASNQQKLLSIIPENLQVTIANGTVSLNQPLPYVIGSIEDHSVSGSVSSDFFDASSTTSTSSMALLSASGSSTPSTAAKLATDATSTANAAAIVSPADSQVSGSAVASNQTHDRLGDNPYIMHSHPTGSDSDLDSDYDDGSASGTDMDDDQVSYQKPIYGIVFDNKESISPEQFAAYKSEVVVEKTFIATIKDDDGDMSIVQIPKGFNMTISRQSVTSLVHSYFWIAAIIMFLIGWIMFSALNFLFGLAFLLFYALVTFALFSFMRIKVPHAQSYAVSAYAYTLIYGLSILSLLVPPLSSVGLHLLVFIVFILIMYRSNTPSPSVSTPVPPVTPAEPDSTNQPN